MGFKKIKKVISEDEFINQARGEIGESRADKKVVKKEKRDKTFLMYFTESELDRIRIKADEMGMGVNQFIRFKIFN